MQPGESLVLDRHFSGRFGRWNWPAKPRYQFRAHFDIMSEKLTTNSSRYHLCEGRGHGVPNLFVGRSEAAAYCIAFWKGL